MKWIEDLPDDFTQDFRFSVTGVDDPRAWLNDELKIGQQDWKSVITLTRDDILRSTLIWKSISTDDMGGHVIQWAYSKNHTISNDFKTEGCCIVYGVVRSVYFLLKENEVVPDLSDLSGLCSVSIQGARINRITSVLNLPGLTSLSLSYFDDTMIGWMRSPEAKFEGISLMNLVGLKSLRLSGFIIEDWHQFSKLKQLNRLNCTGSKIPQDTKRLSSLVNLTVLKLGVGEVQSWFGTRARFTMSGLSILDSLVELEVTGSSDLDFSWISNLSRIRVLHLQGCPALQKVPELSGLTCLTSLNLCGSETLQEVSGLSGLSGLTSLDLSNCKALEDLSGLSGLTGLTSLDLSHCEALEDVSELSGLSGLTSLKLNGCKLLKDLSGLSGLTGLTSLELNNCKSLADVSELSGLSGLTSLDLCGCELLKDLSGLSGLTSLTSLDLSGCELLKDLSGLSGLTSLTSLDLSNCKSLADVSMLAGLTRLTSLKLGGCPFVDHDGNRQSIANFDALKKLHGIGEPWRTLILWNAARRREGKVDMSALLEKMLELCGSPISNLRLRADLIAGLSVFKCSDEQMGQIHDLGWNREEWARLLVETDNQLDPVASGPQFGINQETGEVVMETDFTLFTEAGNGQGAVNVGSGRIGIRNAMKGYLLSVAEGARWEGHEAVLKEAFGHITSELNKEGVELHPSWEEGVVDLLMALRETGMTQEHDALFKAVTDESRLAFDQRLRIQAAEAALDGGRWSDALQHMRDLPSTKEAQLMDRLIPHVVGDEVPEVVLDWMETAADHDLGLLVENKGMTPAEGLRNRRIREQLFFLSASNAAMFRELVGQMFAAFRDDPWVAALMTECGSRDGGEETDGIASLLTSDAVPGFIGRGPAKKLLGSLEGLTERELRLRAVAAILVQEGHLDADDQAEFLEELNKTTA